MKKCFQSDFSAGTKSCLFSVTTAAFTLLKIDKENKSAQ